MTTQVLFFNVFSKKDPNLNNAVEFPKFQNFSSNTSKQPLHRRAHDSEMTLNFYKLFIHCLEA